MCHARYSMELTEREKKAIEERRAEEKSRAGLIDNLLKHVQKQPRSADPAAPVREENVPAK